ncbi:MAG: hypothetical protein GY720_07320, partial [bacterium]|nr:hypothetical protein [bacterium]
MIEEDQAVEAEVRDVPVRRKQKRRWLRRLVIGILVAVVAAAAGWGILEVISPEEPTTTVQVELPDALPSGPAAVMDPFEGGLAESGWSAGGPDSRASDQYLAVQAAAFLKRVGLGPGNATVMSFEWLEPDIGSIMFEDTTQLFGAIGLRIGRSTGGYEFTLQGGPSGGGAQLSQPITPRPGVVYTFYALVSEERRAFGLWERGKPEEAEIFLDNTLDSWFADRSWVYT